MNKELLSIKEMAEYLGCDRTLSYKLLQPGPDAIPAYRVGKSLRIRREHLDEWLERNRSSDLHRH